jgi:flagellar biosynthesis protein
MSQEEKNGIKKIVGLQYKKGDGLPRVILKGQGYVADEIIRRRSISNPQPLVKDEKLAQQLYKLPIDGEITPDLFELVAILLVHVYSVEEKMK